MVADLSQNPDTSSPANIPAWGGYTAYSVASGWRLSDINQFRALGGDVVLSFGGQSGTELAGYITNTVKLQQAYQSAIDVYNATRIDFDIEGSWAADLPSINRRSPVIAALQTNAVANGKTLEVSFTLQVQPSGLDPNGIYILQSAVSNGVAISTVNIMAMDYYGSWDTPTPAGKMGEYAIMAATNLFNQLKSIYQTAGISKTDAQLWQMIGVTPMIGVNDDAQEIFDQAAATQLMGFAISTNIGMIGFWSLNRDQPGDSGVTQTSFEFTKIFLPFATATGDGLPQFTAVSRQGNNLLLTWQAAGGTTNWIQSKTNLLSAWSDLSPAIAIMGNGTTTTNWTVLGAISSSGSSFYRIKMQ
ncbi:MAG TPA: chitinase [Verrucomicrobiae bacterium]